MSPRRIPAPRRSDLAKVRRRYRVDAALMGHDDTELLIAAKDYWHAQAKRLRPAQRRAAALALIQLAERLTEDAA